MKAIIAKNNDFETVGFEVSNSGEVIFRWGVAPLATFHFVKEISCNDWMSEIFQLVRLQERINEQFDFTRNFFRCLEESNKLEEAPYNLSSVDAKQKRNAEKMENIIKAII